MPYIAIYLSKNDEHINYRKYFNSFSLYYTIYAIVKLFLVALILPEVEGFKPQTFVINMVISSFEFVAYHLSLKKKSDKDITIITYVWSLITAVFSSLLPFISNSRTYEVEFSHIIYAFSAVSYLFQWFAAKNISESIPRKKSVTDFDIKTQLFVLSFGLPQAFDSIGSIEGVPDYLTGLLRLGVSVVLYFASSLLTSKKEKQN